MYKQDFLSMKHRVRDRFPVVLNTFFSKHLNRFASHLEERHYKNLAQARYLHLSLPKIKENYIHFDVDSKLEKDFEVIGKKKDTIFKYSKKKFKKVRANRFSSKLVREVSLSVDIDNDPF